MQKYKLSISKTADMLINLLVWHVYNHSAHIYDNITVIVNTIKDNYLKFIYLVIYLT
jgi:hypothetical protein